MDYVMANPPFNIKDWARDESDPRWCFGVPPAGNANFAWIQHILSKLAPRGKAGSGDDQRLDVVKYGRRRRHSRRDHRRRPGVLHGRPAHPAVSQHRNSGVPLVL